MLDSGSWSLPSSAWWPDYEDERRWMWLRTEQERYDATFDLAAACFRRAFNAGVLLLLGGVGLALVPSHGWPAFRLIAVGACGLATLGEIAWLVGNWARTLGAPGQDPFSPRRRAKKQ